MLEELQVALAKSGLTPTHGMEVVSLLRVRVVRESDVLPDLTSGFAHLQGQGGLDDRRSRVLLVRWCGPKCRLQPSRARPSCISLQREEASSSSLMRAPPRRFATLKGRASGQLGSKQKLRQGRRREWVRRF